MLTRESLEGALPLAEQLDARGLFLQPIPSTPLAVLVEATRAGAQFNVPLDGGGYQPDLANIEFMANCQPKDGSANAHDLAMDGIVQVGIKAVQDHMVFAKNVVAPAVDDLVQRVTQGLAAMTTSALLGMEVRLVELPELLHSAPIQAALSKYAETPLDNPRMTVNMPELPLEEIIELMSTGGAGSSREISDWVAAKGEGWLRKLWADVFQIHPVAPNAPLVTFQDIINGEDGADNALGIFLLARRMVDQAPKDVPLPAHAFEQLMADYRNQAAANLCRALAAAEQLEKAGTLVRKQTNRVVWVNGEVYRKWIAAGGSNEVLFGNMLQAQPKFLAKDLDANAAGLKAAWDRHCAVTNTVEQGRRIVRTKELLAGCFEDQVNELAEDDPGLAGERATVIRLFNEVLEEIREEDLRDIYGCALRLLCCSRFAHTEAERILTGIESVKRENPQLDVREAAAVSMIKYVAWWVSTQFKVVSL